jgi:hypothetical protein
VWNEDLSPTRRYVLIRISPDHIVVRVRVGDGETLALLDATGKLTQKYQASIILGDEASELIVERDTENLIPLLMNTNPQKMFCSPTDHGRLKRAALPIVKSSRQGLPIPINTRAKLIACGNQLFRFVHEMGKQLIINRSKLGRLIDIGKVDGDY